LIQQSSAIKDAISEKEKSVDSLRETIDELLYKVGNIVAPDVVDSCNEEDNGQIRTFGECKSGDGLKNHDEVLYMIGGFEPKVGSEVAGHRGYYLTGPGLWLNQALINYALSFLHKKNTNTFKLRS